MKNLLHLTRSDCCAVLPNLPVNAEYERDGDRCRG
jgi:hypothetical protein